MKSSKIKSAHSVALLVDGYELERGIMRPPSATAGKLNAPYFAARYVLSKVGFGGSFCNLSLYTSASTTGRRAATRAMRMVLNMIV